MQISAANYDRQGVANHAGNLASKIHNNLRNSLRALDVDILTGFGTILGPKIVITCDHALKLEFNLDWIAIVEGGYCHCLGFPRV